ncbi:right-handed parallel beta-helix repeat-containing protein [Paenibacillus hodogayensis]|uniref:Right-handed parallel beta-helix repeat-containing protein n=1 Tax=Paenibacillus hodogayensis TaxID=279208 RepID=A0ABV5W1U9_9BACL
MISSINDDKKYIAVERVPNMRARFIHIAVLLLLIVAWSGYEAEAAGEGWVNGMAEVMGHTRTYAQDLRVEDFGAVPDDGIDDTRAIREAMLNASAIPGGARVLFSPGTYEISPPDDVWTFEEEADLSAWPASGAVADAVSGEVRQLTAGQQAVHIDSLQHLGLDAGKYKKAVIRMQNLTAATAGKLYWITDADPVWDNTKSISFTMTPGDAHFTDYLLDTGDNGSWKGVIRQLRFQLGEGSAPGDFMLERIQLQAATPKDRLMYYYSLLFDNLSGVDVVGNGTTLLSTDPIGGVFRCRKCNDISFTGITFDYLQAPFVQGKVTAIDRVNGTFDYVPDSGYSLLDDPRFVHVPRLWGTVRDPDNPYWMKPTARDYTVVQSWNRLDPQTYRLTVPSNMISRLGPGELEAGDTFVLITRDHGNNIFRVEDSQDFAVQDSTVYTSPGTTVLAYYSDEIAINQLQVIRKPGSDRMITTNADGIHVQASRTGPVIENSVFEGMLDDAINIYSLPIVISRVISDTEVEVTVGRLPRTGDLMQAFDPVNGVIKGTAAILSVQPVSGLANRATIVWDRPVPNLKAGTDHKTADTLYNLNNSGSGFAIKNNIFRDSRRYGAFIKSGDGVIEGNRFYDLGGSAIAINNDPDYPEGPIPGNIRIADNEADRVAYLKMHNNNAYNAAILIRSQKLGSALSNEPNIGNISVENNRILHPPRHGIYIGGVKDATLIGNQIEATGSDPVYTGVMTGMTIESSRYINVNQTTIVDPRPELTAGIRIAGTSSHNSAGQVNAMLNPGVPSVLDQSSIVLTPQAVVINTTSSGYTEEAGTWDLSGLKGYNGGATRYSFSANAAARWTPALQSGHYRVLLYRVVHSNSDPNSQIEIVHQGGSKIRTVDYTAGASGWTDLGVYEFSGGTSEYVRLSRLTSQTATALRTDAVAFEPLQLSTALLESPEQALPQYSETMLQISGMLEYDRPADLSGAQITYVSSSPSVAEFVYGPTVGTAVYGRVIARSPGTAEIKAVMTIAGVTKESNRVTVEVVPVPISLQFNGVPSEMQPHKQRRITVTAMYSDGLERVVSGSLSLTSSNPEEAEVDSNGLLRRGILEPQRFQPHSETSRLMTLVVPSNRSTEPGPPPWANGPKSVKYPKSAVIE